ncbi:hypothetical protein [Thermomonospora cellulosilytica]|uniref:Uncharacterized protein n=1 Tax=Thermomonospora cellulosilytica TaxID=1411118 RepID=A0A7W3N2Q6_9ACTN|nr:hypothetical protein [Thermomonospora cellulosilytica]MBA9006393.1 hypothetical protein [Thermomonospora cellulosilytica]
MRTLLFVLAAIALVAWGFAGDMPWLWGLGLLVGLGALLGDKDPVQARYAEQGAETPQTVRRMRSRDL